MIASHETKKSRIPNRSPETARKTFQPTSSNIPVPNA